MKIRWAREMPVTTCAPWAKDPLAWRGTRRYAVVGEDVRRAVLLVVPRCRYDLRLGWAVWRGWRRTQQLVGIWLYRRGCLKVEEYQDVTWRSLCWPGRGSIVRHHAERAARMAKVVVGASDSSVALVPAGEPLEPVPESIPYVGFSNDDLAEMPAAKPGDRFQCPRCGESHELEGSDAGKGPEHWSTNVLMFYTCQGGTYLGAVAGRFVVGRAATVDGELQSEEEGK